MKQSWFENVWGLPSGYVEVVYEVMGILEYVNMPVNSVHFLKIFPSCLANTMKCSNTPAGVTVLYFYASPTMLNKWTFSFKKHTITLFPFDTSRRLCAPLT